jgi:hypothetical protein
VNVAEKSKPVNTGAWHLLCLILLIVFCAWWI